MDLTRRRFLSGIGAGALWGATAVAGAGAAARAAVALAGGGGATRPDLDLATATAETFRPHVGSRFRLGGAGPSGRDLELAAVDGRPPDGGLTDSFALAFRDPGPAGLPQAIYRLEHDVLGGFGLFLVAGAGGTVAVVNHVLR